MSYSTAIAETINNFLIEDDWHFEFDEEKGIFRFDLSIKSKIKNLSYVIVVNEDDFSIYATSPVGADSDDDDMMAEMAEFITRVNYGMKNGNFEMDYRDGEIRYKVFVDCEESLPDDVVIKNGIFVISSVFRRYANGITGIIFGGLSGQEACEMCERE